MSTKTLQEAAANEDAAARGAQDAVVEVETQLQQLLQQCLREEQAIHAQGKQEEAPERDLSIREREDFH